MNKKEFISYLDNKLVYLVDAERNKEIEKYVKVIDNYVNMGQSEEAAIASFGNIDDIIVATYLSHGLDYKKIDNPTVGVKGIKGSLKKFYNIISGNDKKAARNAIFYFLYLILLVIILKVLFILARDLGASVFEDLISNNVINKIYYLFFEVIYIVTAIIVFIKMFTKKFK